MSRPRLVSCLLVAAVCVAAAAVRASVVAPMTFDALVGSADVVFRGTVVHVEPFWTATPSGRAIVTRVTFRVDRPLKGAASHEVALEFLGGRIDDVALQVSGVPQFEVGQVDVICARMGEPRVSPIVGFNQGRFRVNRERTSGRQFVTLHDGWALSSVAEIGKARVRSSATPLASLTLDVFEQSILQLQRPNAR